MLQCFNLRQINNCNFCRQPTPVSHSPTNSSMCRISMVKAKLNRAPTSIRLVDLFMVILDGVIFQNLGEAEYACALYTYMRILGYPAEKISILTTYNGQAQLLRDVFDRRCSNNPLIGPPAKVKKFLTLSIFSMIELKCFLRISKIHSSVWEFSSNI